MKGLILNNLYSMGKGIKSAIFLTFVTVVGLLMFEDAFAMRIAAFLPFLLIPVHAFEVNKHDNMSGWNKFEITLPVTRHEIVQSKYATFLLLFLFSATLTITLFFIVNFFIPTAFTMVFFNFMLRGMGMILCIAVIVYPLTYILGVEKSDFIMVFSMGFAFGMFGLVFVVLQMMIGIVDGFDEIFSITFLSFSIFLFIISYIISTVVYMRKEF